MGRQASVTSRTVMFCLAGFSARVSSGAWPGSDFAATAPVSALSSVSRSARACWRLSTVSRARDTSCASFMVRPAPRAAVVARPSVVALTALRPRSAPSTVAPREIATWSPCWVAWPDSRSTACWARRIFSWSTATFGAYFFRSSSSASSRPSRPACWMRTRKSPSDSSGRDTSLRSALTWSSSRRVRNNQPAKSRLQLSKLFFLPATPGSSPNSAPTTGSVSRSPRATGVSRACSQSTPIASSVMAVRNTPSWATSTPRRGSVKRTCAAPSSMG